MRARDGHSPTSSNRPGGGDEPAESRLRADRLRAGHADRRVAGAWANGGHGDPHSAHLPARSDRRSYHAQRHLLWRHVRRHHHVGADQRAGRSRLRHHLFRRLRNGQAGPRRHRARDCRHRLLHRRHRGDDCADCGRAAAGTAGVELWPAGVLCADAGRPRPDHRSCRELGGDRGHDGRARIADRYGRHRSGARRATLHLSASRASTTASASSRS